MTPKKRKPVTPNKRAHHTRKEIPMRPHNTLEIARHNTLEIARQKKLADLIRRGIIVVTETPTGAAPRFAARTRKGTVT